MSGGSLDYLCFKVYDAAESIRIRATRAEHIAFANHLVKVGKALHDLEWVWSCDYGPGDEIASINSVVEKSDVLEAATAKAQAALDELARVLNK